MIDTVFHKAYVHTLANDGGTFLLPKMMPLSPTADVYVLSLDDERGSEIPIASFTMTALNVYVMNNMPFVMNWNSRTTTADVASLKAIGTWIDNGTVYMDVVTIYPKEQMPLDDVLAMARACNQRAIWDNGRQVAIETGLAR